MQFTCSTSKLIEALQTATKALSSRTTNPILEGVLVTTGDDTLKLTCSDERLTIVTRFEAKIIEPGSGVVPGKLFSDIVRRLPGEECAVRMDEKFVFRISSGATRMNITGQDPDLFPMLPRLQDIKEISLPQDLLRDMIQKTEFAIAVDDMREVLTGALLELDGGDICMVALDGYRLALRRAKCSELVENVKVIIPGRAVGELGKLLSEDEEAFATLSFDGKKLHVALDGTDVYMILVAGEYVKYNQILPKSFASRVTVNKSAFSRCVDRAALIARDGSNNLVILKIADNIMRIEAHSQLGDMDEELDIVQQGADISIAFNVKYVTDVVRYIDAEEIEMNFNNAVSPCIITPAGDSDYVHLILPVRTGATR